MTAPVSASALEKFSKLQATSYFGCSTMLHQGMQMIIIRQ
jgi:hypothetical protein